MGKIHSYTGVAVEHGQIEVVEHLKYLGSLKSADGNCNSESIVPCITKWKG